MPDLSSILSLLADYGYVIVFVGVLMESAGIPIPGETVLIAAGVLVQRHDLDLRTTIALGIAGAIVGDQIGYLVGRRGGRPFVLRWGRYVAITPERLERADEFFDRHGGPAVFAARFVPGLRVFGALMAGISRMRWSTFIVFNALGGIVWATAAVLAGVLAGSSYRLVEQWVGRVGMLVAGLVVLGLVGTVLVRRHRRGHAR